MTKAESTQLSLAEQGELKELVSIVNRCAQTMIEAGTALRNIRERKLWRGSHKSFDAFVKAEWGYGSDYANKMIASSEVSQKLNTIVVSTPKALEITKESQLRELTSVPTKHLPKVIATAAKIAGDDPITAKDIKQAREEVLATETKPAPPRDAWEDVVDEPETALNHETVAERAAKMKSMIKQHNAAMMRTVDDLQKIMPRNTSHKSIHLAFREIHQTIEGWK